MAVPGEKPMAIDSLNPPDGTVLTRHPLAICIVSSGAAGRAKPSSGVGVGRQS